MTIFLETNRLILKAPEQSELNDLIALRTDPEVMKYLGTTGAIQTPQEVGNFLENAIQYQKKHGFGFCSVFEKSSNQFVGQAGLFYVGFAESGPEVEVAYRLHKKFWGQGYATELAKALIHWGFKHLPVDKLVSFVHPENLASRRVLEKSGMDYLSKDSYRGVTVYRYEIYKIKVKKNVATS